MKQQLIDEKYMRMALALAAKARGRTSPNPMVGAVVVKSGKVVSRGYHTKAGAPHAEALALARAGEKAKGATLYVTLEPCSHTNKRTPPCAPLVVKSGVKRVVVAMVDPNPQVSGDGIRTIRKAGIEVATGVREQEAKHLNEAYVKQVTKRMPFVTLKIAQTLDGRTATASGESKWITGEEARKEGRRLRDINDAILVGINTVLKDDPSLTTRVPGGRDPVRIILDSRLRIPMTAKVVRGRSTAPTIVVTLASAPEAKIRKLQEAGVEVLVCRSQEGRVDLRHLMKTLAGRGILSVLVEGGSEVHASALKAGIADKVALFIAPLFMAGRDALPSIGGVSPLRLRGAVALHGMIVRWVGRDIQVEGYLR